jgi:predicted glycogen debranching enzyme
MPPSKFRHQSRVEIEGKCVRTLSLLIPDRHSVIEAQHHEPRTVTATSGVLLSPEDIKLEPGLDRGWLVTNGLGSYALGSVSGARTRRSHGLLVAALEPPSGQHILVAQLIERAISPDGTGMDLRKCVLESFTLERSISTWRYRFGQVLLEKQIWMRHGTNTTFVTYTPVAGETITLELQPLCTHHEHLAQTNIETTPNVAPLPDGLELRYANNDPYFIRANTGGHTRTTTWQRDSMRQDDTLEVGEDLYGAGHFAATLALGQTFALVLSTNANTHASEWCTALESERLRNQTLQKRTRLEREPGWIQGLVIKADQFVVARGHGRTVISRYPEATDSGRDAMIALPGLTLVTGQPRRASSLLRSAAQFLDQGLIPNRFSSGDHVQPEYDTPDAGLWFVHALQEYVRLTGDESLVDELWVTLEAIMRWHIGGSQHGIGMDAVDGLLRVTTSGARIGKPVEVNALWYNALRALEAWATTRRSMHNYRDLADLVANSFGRYWNPETEYLFDVLDGPNGDDSSIRSNAVIAASLGINPLEPAWRKSVVDVASKYLLTTNGLLTYARDQTDQNANNHVQRWLLGSFVEAHLRVYRNPLLARSFFEQTARDLRDDGGSWQACDVAEILRAWKLTVSHLEMSLRARS